MEQESEGMTEKSGKVNESQIDFLKPCPFCKNDVEMNVDKTDGQPMIVCPSCMIFIKLFFLQNEYNDVESILTEVWNRR